MEFSWLLVILVEGRKSGVREIFFFIFFCQGILITFAPNNTIDKRREDRRVDIPFRENLQRHFDGQMRNSLSRNV